MKKKGSVTSHISIQLTSLRKKAGWSQRELAKRIGTSQQQISRLESNSYEGHSLSMLRRVAKALGATIRVEIQPKSTPPHLWDEIGESLGKKGKMIKKVRKGE